MGKRLEGKASRKIELLAKELSFSAQLSFDERVAGTFLREAKGVIARTRNTYQMLIKNLTRHTKETQGVETLLDNSHLIAGVLAELVDRWRRKETMRLPQVVDGDGKMWPRVYLVAQALARETSVNIDRELIVIFLKRYQRAAPFSVRELDIFPDMLRFALIEELLLAMNTILFAFREVDEAEWWFARIMSVVGRRVDAERLTLLANLLVKERKVVSVRFGLHLLRRLMQSGRERDLRVVSKWLKFSLARQGVNTTRLSEALARSEREQAKIIDHAVASLHWLGQMRWDRVSPPLNAVDAMLARDPSGVFSLLTNDTRAEYRRTIVRIADRASVHDVEVAREALRLARAARESAVSDAKRRMSHVGYFLIDEGISALERTFRYQLNILERLRRAILKYRTRAYLGVIIALSAFLITFPLLFTGGLELSAWTFLPLFFAGLILSSEIAIAIAHFVFTRLLFPRPLPQIDCEKGVGISRRTITVISSFIRDNRSAEHLLSRLETNFIANNDPNIFYAALMDFRDAPKAEMPDDESALLELESGVLRLNERYPSEIPRFSLFYRKRIWNERENVFMGWERKRGKLREFNRLLRGKPTSYEGGAIEKAAKFGPVRYVLTIDEDAELTRDSAKALIGTIDHPLNRPVIDPIRRVVVEGYGIIMPRIALRFRDGAASAFSRLFGGFPGIEAYSTVVSDLHQDFFGEGIFHGKGIYDIDVVEATMEGKIPENTVLSHDLLEGLYARVGTAMNAYVFEGFPKTYREYMLRAHRWIRGDWQIIGWIFPKHGGVFSPIGRWRIIDNLRRSLLPVALFFAVADALFSPAGSLFWSIFGLTALGAGQLMPAVKRIFNMATSFDKKLTLYYRIETAMVEFSAAGAKTVLLGIFALQNAIITFDAITRSMWRLFVSKRKLLEWRTTYETAGQTKEGLFNSIRSMRQSVFVALILIFANFIPGVVVDPLFFTWTLIWVSAPLAVTIVSVQRRKRKGISSRDVSYLYTVAAKTYWFFVDMAMADTQWLPPDHFQEEPVSKRHSHGLGVSPTNLGMYLLSLSAARALGLTTIAQYSELITKAFASMARLERYRGHFFNWYELKGLLPLAPRYVSSVDSANLALALLAVRSALLEALDAPLLSRAMFKGLDAELSVLSLWSLKAVKESKGDRPKRKLFRDLLDAVNQARSLVQNALSGGVTPRGSELVYSGAAHQAVRIRNTIETLRMEEEGNFFDGVFLAARHVETTAAQSREIIARYLGYAIVPAISAVTNDKELQALYIRLSETLSAIPSVNSIANGKIRNAIENIGFSKAIERSLLPSPDKDYARAWYGEILTRLGEAEKATRAIREELSSAALASRNYFDEMDFSFLYNEERGLFHMGYNSLHERLDEIFYDLFASEANAVSLVGIAKRHAPKEHWTYLSRKLVRSSNHAATPVSWAGSLFEYLGTLLYFDIPNESFWGVSAQRAIAAHRHLADRFHIPWGMGESASSSVDVNDNYRYRAFGEPSIGLRRDLSESVVVAPYTTALALPIIPHLAIDNFRQLVRAGASGRYGFYDAIDYTARNSGKDSPPGVPARIYYAHHQGFILSSIANAILSGWVHRMIAGEPDMKVAAQLFEEKMPNVLPVKPLHIFSPPKQFFGRTKENGFKAPRRYIPARPKEAQWNFLSNGTYHVALSSAGAGESRYEDINITRQNDDVLTESRGTFFYLFDRERGVLWSPTYMPTKTMGERSSVSMGEQIAIYEKTYKGIASILSIAVVPNAPVEVRELTITNHRPTPVVLSVGACAEIALARLSEAATSQNFRNLFLASEVVLGGSGIFISRSDSRSDDHSIAAGFLVTTPTGRPGELRMIRGREAFFGPLMRRDNPLIMKDFKRADVLLPKHTLDTAAGFVATFTFRPGQTRQIAFITAAGESREAVLEKLRPYQKYRYLQKVLAGADHAGASALSTLGITPSQAEIFYLLASLLITRKEYAASGLRVNTAPLIGALWRCGISGARPIVLLSVSVLADLPLVRQMLACHSYFLSKGIDADIVILNKQSGGYLKILEDEIDFLLRVHGDTGKIHGSRIFYVRGEELSANEIGDILIVATIHIDARKGALSDQVRALNRVKAAKLPPLKLPINLHLAGNFAAISRKWKPTDINTLEHANSIGGYDNVSGAYVVLPKEGHYPPQPWSNIVANEHIGFLATDRGMSFTWARNSYDNKLTRVYDDPLSAETGETIYVRDEITGVYFSPLPITGNPDARYEIRHGEGYTEYQTHQGGLGIRLILYVAPSAPIKYYSLFIKNDTEEDRQLTAFGYFELLLGSFPRETKKHLVFNVREGNTFVVQNVYRNIFPESRVFLGISGGAGEFTTSKEEFLGRFGNLVAPAGLTRKGLSSCVSPDGEPAAVLSRKVALAPGEEETVVFFLGEADSDDALTYLINDAVDKTRVKESLGQAVSFWKSFPKLSLDLPDRSLSLLCNRFLPYQTLASRIYARAGFYQISGAFGFRDQLQDVLSLLWHDPAIARSHILAFASHQFQEGDALSWWSAHNNFGARTLISDPHLWLPYAVLRYVEFTGDTRILDEETPYLEGEIPNTERQSIVGMFYAGEERGTIYEHCVRAIERGLTFGAHGFPLIGAADWNDGMNRVGNEGKGESVWLALFMIILLREMSDLALRRGDQDRALRYRNEADRYRDALKHFGWDGGWYRRAYTDSGVPVGTRLGKSWRLDSVSQSWAMFALGKTSETLMALRSAKEELRIREGHVPLAWPPSDPTLLDLGTLSDYPPGVRENAAQYNHAALWLAQAMILSGDTDGGMIIIDAVNPFKRSETIGKAVIYRGEPYVVAAEIYSAPTYPGRAGWTWYTASAGVLYLTVVEYLLGLKRKGDELAFHPAFPSNWNKATVRYTFGKSLYIIRYQATSLSSAKLAIAVLLDGQEIKEGTIRLIDDEKTHEVTVRFGRSKKA